MRLLVILLVLPVHALAQPCPPAAQTTVEIILPGRAGMPQGSQLRLNLPIDVETARCDQPTLPVDTLRGPPSRTRLLNGDADINALTGRPLPKVQTASPDSTPPADPAPP